MVTGPTNWKEFSKEARRAKECKKKKCSPSLGTGKYTSPTLWETNPNYTKLPAHFRTSILKKLKKGWGLSTVVDKINMEFPQKPS